MSTAEAIFEKAKALPDDRQLEALRFVTFLLSQEHAQAQASEWSAFSGSQLSRQYGEGDAIYDQPWPWAHVTSAGELLLASLLFTSQEGTKKPASPSSCTTQVMMTCWFLPVTSHTGRSDWDIFLTDWRQAGLRLPSVVRLDKPATIAKSTVIDRSERSAPTIKAACEPNYRNSSRACLQDGDVAIR